MGRHRKAEPRVCERGEAGTLCGAASSLAESGARPAHSEGLYSTSAAHQSLSPAPLPLFSLSQLKRKHII